MEKKTGMVHPHPAPGFSTGAGERNISHGRGSFRRNFPRYITQEEFICRKQFCACSRRRKRRKRKGSQTVPLVEDLGKEEPRRGRRAPCGKLRGVGQHPFDLGGGEGPPSRLDEDARKPADHLPEEMGADNPKDDQIPPGYRDPSGRSAPPWRGACRSFCRRRRRNRGSP